jgi:hypothetical protein
VCFWQGQETYPGKGKYMHTVITNKQFYYCLTLYLTKYPYCFCDLSTQSYGYCRGLLSINYPYINHNFLLHIQEFLDVYLQASGRGGAMFNDGLPAGPQAVLYIEGRWYIFSQNFSSFLNTGERLAVGILQHNQHTRITETYGFKLDITFTWDVTECHFTDVRLRTGQAVAQLAEALSYKPEGRGFDYWWCHIGIFQWQNPSVCTTALGLIQSLTEMSSRNISWG